jgi:hypothetical protein
MESNDDLYKEYKSVIENLPHYKGDFDDPLMFEWYQKGFEEWKKLKKDYEYYTYCASNS